MVYNLYYCWFLFMEGLSCENDSNIDFDDNLEVDAELNQRKYKRES